MRTPACSWLAIPLALLVGCDPGATGPARDPHSFSRPDEIVVRHLDLDLTVDFETHRLEGSATLEVDNLTGARELWLDSGGLDVRRVGLGKRNDETAFRFGEGRPWMGRPLVIEVEPGTTRVRIDYASSPEATALQWLEPRQTAGGRHPFLLSQSQACLARTWIPCQDTPGVRMTYEATVRVPPELTALMSAENPTERAADGRYTFRMPQPIPSYLLALAVGDVVFLPLGPRSGVWAEPEIVGRAAWEFAETEQMIAAAERLYGPYRWGRYDIIVLPPSFPYGGMENPRLTFATPTILTGDRSLVALVAHELAHSWSGNLVTNSTWNDFWLNEGFTSYFEYRIMEELYGRDYSEMLWLLGRRGLEDEMVELDLSDTRLALDFSDRDPDAVPYVVYDKGALFLRLLEESVGRERWDRYLRDYFERHAFGSMTTSRFLDDLSAELLDDAAWRDLQVEAWVHGPGLPDNAPRIASPAFEEVERSLAAWLDGGPLPQTSAWSSHEWVHFVHALPQEVRVEQLAELDEAYGLTDSGNAELLTAWLSVGLERGYPPATAAAERFVTGMGRAKFLVPLYRRLAAGEEGRARAAELFDRARGGYHPVAVTAVERALEQP